MKQCTRCKEVKPYSSYHKNKKNNDGYTYLCSDCKRKHELAHQRTPKGIITMMYSNHRHNSKVRGHELPSYTKQWLSNWILSQGKFYVLHVNYILSNYDRDYKPSVDRIHDELPYTKDNIQLMTVRDNMLKGYKDAKERGHVKIHNK